MEPSHLFKVSVQERQEEIFTSVYRRVRRRDSDLKDQGEDRELLWQRDFSGRRGQRKPSHGQSAEATPETAIYNAKGRIVSFGHR